MPSSCYTKIFVNINRCLLINGRFRIIVLCSGGVEMFLNKVQERVCVLVREQCQILTLRIDNVNDGIVNLVYAD